MLEVILGEGNGSQGILYTATALNARAFPGTFKKIRVIKDHDDSNSFYSCWL